MRAPRSLMRPVRSIGLVAALMALSSEALACPVCFAAKNEASREAFIWTTALLTFLPLMLLGLGIWWLIRRERQISDEETAARSEAQSHASEQERREAPPLDASSSLQS